MPKPPRRPSHSRVPTGRLERLARLGWMAGGFAASGLVESARRALAGEAGDAASAVLSGPQAEKLARRLASMRGAAMKLGQLLSLEGADILPPEFTERLSILRADADTMPPSQVRRVLGREYGKGWESRFRDFDFEPVASASIGQVHRVTTRDGRELALKIQYPGIARSISSDVDNVASLLRLARLLPVDLDVSGLLDEAKRQLQQEADYLSEADFQRRYAALVAGEPRLHVPAVHDDLTTRRVLASDFVRALPIEELGGHGVSQERRDAAGELLQTLLHRELFEFQLMQTDPNFANYLIDAENERIVLLDFGSTREFEPRFVEHYRALCRALLRGDREGVRRFAVAIGYLRPDEAPERVRGFADLLLLVCEPVLAPGRYDFGASDLSARARDAGLELFLRRGVLIAPPPQTLFLQRKLVGAYLLLSRIKARLDVRRLLEPFLGG